MYLLFSFQTKEVSNYVSVEKMLMCDWMGNPYILRDHFMKN